MAMNVLVIGVLVLAVLIVVAIAGSPRSANGRRKRRPDYGGDVLFPSAVRADYSAGDRDNGWYNDCGGSDGGWDGDSGCGGDGGGAGD
jgi:hypothetical protein